MSASLRVAVAGVGLISEQSHIPAVLAHPRATLAALVDPAVPRAERVARAFGVKARITANLDDVLPHVDAVVVATPNDTHAEIACRVLDAGRHVLIEKPLASSVSECEAIIAAAQRNCGVVATGYVTRFRDSVLTVSDLLNKGHFGAVKGFAYQFGTPGGWAPYSAYNISRKAAGGGVVMVTGTHFIDRMLHFFGTPDEYEYEDDAAGGPEANAVARFGYHRDGAQFVGAARFSKTTRLAPGLVIDTDAGKLIVPENDAGPPLLRPADEPSIELSIQCRGERRFPNAMSSFLRQMHDFVGACLDGTSPLVSAHDGLRSLELIETLYSFRKPMACDWYSAGDRP